MLFANVGPFVPASFYEAQYQAIKLMDRKDISMTLVVKSTDVIN